MNIQITLTNGRTIKVRSRIVKAGTLVGYMKWDGGFINKVNVRCES